MCVSSTPLSTTKLASDAKITLISDEDGDVTLVLRCLDELRKIQAVAQVT